MCIRDSYQGGSKKGKVHIWSAQGLYYKSHEYPRLNGARFLPVRCNPLDRFRQFNGNRLPFFDSGTGLAIMFVLKFKLPGRRADTNLHNGDQWIV